MARVQILRLLASGAKLLSALPPAPNPTDAVAVEGWIVGRAKPLAEFVAAVADSIVDDLVVGDCCPNCGPDCCPKILKECEEALAEEVASTPGVVGKIGDGKLLELLKQLLPYLIQILPLFLNKQGT